MARRTHKTVLFLCTGNYYRSRFAEALFNSVAGKMRLPWQATSRGLALERGVNNVGPMATVAIWALEALNVCAGDECTRHPQEVTTDDLERAHRVVALKRDEQLPLLRERFPAWAENVKFWDVDDGPEALALIQREVMGLVARILGGGTHGAEQPAEPAAAPQTRAGPAQKLLMAKVGRPDGRASSDLPD